MFFNKSSYKRIASLLVLSFSLLTPCFGQDPSGRPTETAPPKSGKKPPRKQPARVEPGPMTITLTVLTDPAESDVYINGDKRGVTNSEGKIQFDRLSLGRYSVEVRKDGYNPVIRGFQAGAESPTLKFTLEASLDKYVQQFDALVAAGKLAGPESPNALEVVNEASTKIPDKPEIARMRGVLAAKLVETITPLINTTATNWRGVTRDELARALDASTKAVALRKDDNRTQAEAAYLKGALTLLDFQSGGESAGAGLAGARSEFENAVRLEPSFAAAHYQLGVVLQAMGEAAGAETALLKTTQLEPRWAHAFSALGAAYSGQGKHKEAIDAYRRAIEIDPKLSRAYAGLGLARFLKGDKDGIKDIERAAQIDPTSALPHLNLGIVLAQSKSKKDRTRAEEELDKAIKMNSGNLEFQNQIAEKLLADLKARKK
ncbi:MAG TPA: tetratricopeptide repeat protein [Blastocatellia bacterium]|nr:tetratricopeptide repeat protein [Blastocatellia bacterium]